MIKLKIIGLTGGIASGKSTVARVLKDMGAILLDSDEFAHAVIEPHKPAWNDIVEQYGKEILNPDLTINREKLGAIVFNDSNRLEELNHITHPRVFELIRNHLQEIKNTNPDAIVILDVPLLYEIHMERMCDKVWVVWVDRATQINRLMLRNNYSREEAIKRINAQMPLDEKAKRADVVIDNSNSIEETREIITRYFNAIF